MSYIKVNANNTTVYPYGLWQLATDFPNISFPQPLENAPLADFGVYPVTPSARPAYDRTTQKLVETTPIKSGATYTQAWTVQSLTAQEQQAVALMIKAEVVQATQDRLDTFARTRLYDGILSLCTYATSPTQKFADEGQYGVIARDATWAKLYEILGEVQAGTRPMPAGYADIESELPVLTWPL